MGRATDALLIYGYDLGSSDNEDGWKVEQASEYGDLPPLPWYNPSNISDGDDDEDDDFPAAVEAHLLKTLGDFNEIWTRTARVDGYWDRRKQAQQRVGVTIRAYCSDGAPMYALAAHTTVVARGSVDFLEPVDLAERPVLMNWDRKLAAALDVLGLTPTQDRPRWFLASYGDGFF